MNRKVSLLMVMCAVVACSAIVQAEVVSFWSFESVEGGTVINDQVGGVHLTLSGGGYGSSIVGGGQQAFGDGALKSGAGYCATGNASSYSLDAGTLIFWIKDQSHLQYQRVMATHVRGSAVMDIQWNPDGQLYVQGIPGQGSISGSADSAIADGDWHKVALTYSKAENKTRFYVDDKLVGQGVYVGATTNTGFIHLGGSGSYSTNAGCYLDNASFFDTALTQEEITNYVPEPASLTLLAACGLTAMARRHRQK
jgi:hypothetical protein